MQYFYIFTNSPGEVFAWVKPLVERLNIEFPKAIIRIYLTPCQYSTGNELAVCQRFDGVDMVFSPLKTLKNMVKINALKGFVFFMGGDPFYAKRFAKKTGSTIIAYSEHDWPSTDFDLLINKSTKCDLMCAGLDLIPIKDRSRFVLLPGSRPEHLSVALPIMLKMVETTSEFDVMLSPFTDSKTFNHLKMQYPGVSFRILSSVNDLSMYEYALTIPGTNTMQLAYLKVPFMMIFPTHDASILRLNGIAGLLLLIPLIGPILKRVILTLAIRKKRFYSLPNIVFKKLLFPELVGPFNLNDAQFKWVNFVNDESRYIECLNQLCEFDSIQNPLTRIVDFIKSSN